MGIFRRKDSSYWWFRIQMDGKVLTGSTNTVDRRLAMRIYLEKQHQTSEEHHLPNQRGKRTSFFEMCGQYLEKHAQVNKRSWKDDTIIVAKLKDFFGDVPLINIQPQNIESYKASRLVHVKPATINRELTVLKTIFSKALIWGYANRNPVKEVALFKEERTPIKILTQAERRKLLEVAPEFLRPILLTALKTGMRQSEILGLQWKDVDLAQETISVTKTKTQRLRQVPVHPELKRTLAALPRHCAYVFGDEKGKRRHQNGTFRKTFNALREALGMPELTFHMLRHNFATELISKGADIRTVQEYMGHSSLRMLQRYAHMNKGIWRSTIQLLGQDTTPDGTTITLRSELGAVEGARFSSN